MTDNIIFEEDDDEEDELMSYGMNHIHEEEDEGCCFPETCIMGGLHLKSECCTAEMMQEMIEAGEA